MEHYPVVDRTLSSHDKGSISSDLFHNHKTCSGFQTEKHPRISTFDVDAKSEPFMNALAPLTLGVLRSPIKSALQSLTRVVFPKADARQT